MKLLIDNYEIADAGNRAGDIYLTHCGAVDLITVKGRNEAFTILYVQTPLKDLSMEEHKRIHELSGLEADLEICELEVWWKSGEQHGCIMIHHSNPELCPNHLKAENSYFSKETVTESVEVKLKRYMVNMGRSGHGNCSFPVEAYSKEEAQAKAYEEAGDHEYSENDADYDIIGMEEVE